MARSSTGGIIRVIVFIGVLAALLAGGAMLASRLMSPAFIVERLQQAVHDNTGRTLQVGGKPSIGFFPRISVVLPDVRLSNPPGMEKGNFVRMQRLELELELWPLLQRELVLKRLHMKRPLLHLLVDGKGRANWQFPSSGGNAGASAGKAAGAGGTGGLLQRIRLAPVVVEKGQVTFEDRQAGLRHQVRDVDVVVRLASPDSPLHVKGGATWRNRRLSLALFVKDPARLNAQGSPLEAFLKMGDAQVEYTGLAGFGKGLKLVGNVSASGRSLRGLLHWLQMDIAPQGSGLGAFALSGALQAEGDVFTLSNLRLKLDGSNAQGSVRLNMSGSTTSLKAALGVDRIITDTYLGKAAATAGNGRRVGEGGGWSKQTVIHPLPRNLRADVRVTVNDLRHRRLRMGPGSARFVLKNGAFSAMLENMRFYDGALSGRLALITTGRTPKVSAVLRLKAVRARPFLDDLAGFRHLSGRLGGEVDVKSLGRSQLEIVGNLTGLANLTFRNGKVHGIDLVKLMELVQKGIVNGWNLSEKATTDFVELAAKFVIVDGIAGVRALRMKEPLVQVSGKGEVDLLRQRLDLSFDGALVRRKGGREKTLLRMPVPLLVKGPWQEPKIYPDMAGILKNPQAAIDRLQQLMRNLGAGKQARQLQKAQEKVQKARARLKDKVKDKVKAERGKLEEKLQRKLDKALGGDGSGQAGEEAAKQMKKPLKGILGR